ncbi:MAG: orotidine-5'-phosphate decarboxylase [Alphaproteobacteria bacterium]|nr:orotidine-5'-phosphate decarboxylase [Alphaproteobacteria bacterium]MBU0797260.1 orotidine-5'-phosphate decarboxylase [Alphaproteobacteria bacterium]MBU0888952.1 orotidine-5'-phosphate decarboxylase [Alphaproteobacteria bacterium]MBU1813972.1 orotidine-5'-phosphate decarboxylase [Alphaproteobacteria bacterium]MBU2090657.1 orotidine-5'-phosphate decarboxylase [Alphaproteobacteria bacterium]
MPEMNNALARVFCAIDTTDLDHAAALARKLGPSLGGVKLGLEFVNAHGPNGVRKVAESGHPIFLDLKYHDIPNTVAGAVRAAISTCRPFMLNVHAAGGKAMMVAARDAAESVAHQENIAKPLVIAVTVLTSLDDADLAAVGQQGPATEQVVRLARLTQDCGLDGIVCSAREISAVRAACGPDFKLIVPGIRPAWSDTGDQKRIMTPADAIRAGADYLVIGRPITGAADPAGAVARIAAEIASA